MIPIFIDTTPLAEEFNLSQQDTDKMIEFVVKEVTIGVAEQWRKEASNVLHQTRENYVNSIYVGTEGRFIGVIRLIGTLNNMLESGATAFDMKVSFSRSSKKQKKKNGKGWYLTIPYQFATSQALGESTIFSGKLPVQVQQAIRAKPFVKDQRGYERTEPLKLDEIPEQFQVKQTHRIQIPESGGFKEYQHKHSIYEGVMRIKNPVTKNTSSSYISFRRVSDESDANAWLHPGFRPLNLADTALRSANVPVLVSRAIDEALMDLGFSSQ